MSEVAAGALRRAAASSVAAAVFIAALVWVVAMLARGAGVLQPFEFLAYDLLLVARSAPAVAPRVARLDITEEDLQSLGSWPIPNEVLARALEALLAHEPRAVGLDIYTDIPVPPGRERLEAVLVSSPSIIAAMKFRQEGETGVRPPPVLEGTDQLGFTDVVVDPGGIVRRGLLFMDDGSRFSTSLALQVALRYLAREGIGPSPDPAEPSHLRLQRTTIPPLEADDGVYVGTDAGGYQFLLDYRELPGSLPSASLSELLEGRVDPALFRDRAVMVGVVAPSVKDFFYTPFSYDFSHGGPTFGPDLHALMVSQLLRFALDGERPLAILPVAAERLWVLLWSLLGAWLGLVVRSPWRFVPASAAGVLALAGLGGFAFVAGWWLPVVPPALAWLASAVVVTGYVSQREHRERDEVMRLFSSHISPQLASVIWEEREQFLHGGRPRPQKLVATCMFTDVHGFTTVSESLDPQALMDWLNEYMAVMTPIVNAHGGVILRFIGDAIMAVFGVPVARTSEEEIRRDARSAVDCALAMNEALIAHNRRLVERGQPLIGMRIGILTGPMVAGSMGTSQRLEFNVHGDTVNTTARIEGFDKQSFTPDHLVTPCRILMGEGTFARVGAEYRTEWLAQARLKGKNRDISVYRVWGRAEKARPDAATGRVPRPEDVAV